MLKLGVTGGGRSRRGGEWPGRAMHGMINRVPRHAAWWEKEEEKTNARECGPNARQRGAECMLSVAILGTFGVSMKPDLKAGLRASLIQRGTKLTLNSLGAQILTFLGFQELLACLLTTRAAMFSTPRASVRAHRYMHSYTHNLGRYVPTCIHACVHSVSKAHAFIQKRRSKSWDRKEGR